MVHGDCPEHEATCCTSPKMPWFVKRLNETAVSYNIEISVCGSGIVNSKVWGTPIYFIELYIK